MNVIQSIQASGGARAPGRKAVIIGIAAVAGLAAVSYGALSLVAAPEDSGARRAQLTGLVAELEEAAAQSQRPVAFGPGAVCANADEAAALLEANLRKAASAGGVELQDLQIGEGGANQRSGLTAQTFSLSAQAQHDAVLGFLRALARSQPEVFVDEADLTPAVSVVNLNLSGRVLCWTIARS